MQRRCLAAALAAALTCALAPSAMAKERAADRLDVYTVVTTADKLTAFEEKGLDVASSTSVRQPDARADGADGRPGGAGPR